MGQESSVVSDDVPPETLSERSLEAAAEYIKSGKARRIVVMTGAGLSTAAGIPDFRSPETGLYANLARLDLPHAEAVFDIGFFRDKPEPFYVLAKELYPGKFHPTISHVFIALLASKGLLFQLFTQNIDCLERAAGVPKDLIVEAHGSFATQRCIHCARPYPDDKMKEHVAKGEVPHCETCNGYVKPDIVFFGEPLPAAFNAKSHYPEEADLALVLGTSLTVHPFAALPEVVKQEIPRVLFNLERVGRMGSRADDVLVLGDCDAGVRRFADALGWRDELEEKWRSIVGEKEAERQLASASKREQGMKDEVDQLAGKVQDVLQLDDDHANTWNSTPDQEAVRNGLPTYPEHEATLEGEESQPVDDEKDDGAGEAERVRDNESASNASALHEDKSRNANIADDPKKLPEIEDQKKKTEPEPSIGAKSLGEKEEESGSADEPVLPVPPTSKSTL